jgi:serine/threonine protein kinase
MNPGEHIGDYEIVSVLGSGGMGQVYKVRNLISERIEAMKVLLPNLETSPELAERFLREIKVQAALDHPHIAKLHTALRAGNRLVMIMEFVEGEGIDVLLSRGTLTLNDAIRYTQQVLEALAYAHARGVVHRDIKPTNIMVTASGAVKLMDFGIAKIKNDRRLTEAGHTMGSLFYMSPEQIRGGDPDPRSDIYALGVTLYEMVTRRRPFVGDSDYSIMAAHLQQTPQAPVGIVPGVPPGLSDVIVMALAREPQARFQSAEAMQAALASVVGPAIPAPAAAAIVTPPLPRSAVVSPPVSAPVAASSAPSASRRGLYMTLGSLATLVVLALAAVEGPKYLRARAGGNAVNSQTPPPAVVQAPQTPSPSPSSTQESPAATPIPTEAPVSQPSRSEPGRPQPGTSKKPISRPNAGQPAAGQQSAPPSQALPVQQPQTQPPVPQKEVQSPPAPHPEQAELNELRERYNELGIRAEAARGGLSSIQQQMASQGLGLRGDIKDAELRMNVQLNAASNSLGAGDVEGTRRQLQYAETAIRTIEKFLGR